MFKTVEIEGNKTKFIVVRILSMTIELVSQPKLIKVDYLALEHPKFISTRKINIK